MIVLCSSFRNGPLSLFYRFIQFVDPENIVFNPTMLILVAAIL